MTSIDLHPEAALRAPCRFALGACLHGALVALALVLAGCETGHRALLGGGMAQGRLHELARDKVLAADAAAAPLCKDRSIATVRVVDRPAVAATDYDRMYSVGLPDVSRGVQTPSAQPSPASTVTLAFTERWVVERCGERAAYRVRFSPGDVVEVFPELQPRRSTQP